jgi:hypothetical protein
MVVLLYAHCNRLLRCMDIKKDPQRSIAVNPGAENWELGLCTQVLGVSKRRGGR